MLRRAAGFDWSGGNWEKCQQHGVSPAEIEEVFRGDVHVHHDTAHSTVTEQRRLAIGKTQAGRYVFIAFTLRVRDAKTLIRPISARYMHRKEIAYYEKETP
jgi:uncharacterized DUF497 family protein